MFFFLFWRAYKMLLDVLMLKFKDKAFNNSHLDGEV